VLAVGQHAKIAKVSFAVDEDGTLVVQRGLSATDEVVLSPSADLKDGDPLDLTPAPAAGPEKKTP
jgi:ribosomal protein L2